MDSHFSSVVSWLLCECSFSLKACKRVVHCWGSSVSLRFDALSHIFFSLVEPNNSRPLSKQWHYNDFTFAEGLLWVDALSRIIFILVQLKICLKWNPQSSNSWPWPKKWYSVFTSFVQFQQLLKHALLLVAGHHDSCCHCLGQLSISFRHHELQVQ